MVKIFNRKRINDFPDYLDYLPKGDMTRKINIVKDYLDVKQQRSEFVKKDGWVYL